MVGKNLTFTEAGGAKLTGLTEPVGAGCFFVFSTFRDLSNTIGK